MIEFYASLWKIQRDHEDESKITLTADSQQLEEIIKIPSQKLLKVVISVEE